MSEGEKRYYDQRAEREFCREAKRRAFALEMDNNSQLILFRSMQNYWKMGGVSALEYYYHIAQKIGVPSVAIHSDRDLYSRFKDGIVSIRFLSKFDERLGKVGIKFDKEESGVRIYNLGYTLTRDSIEEMRNERITLLRRANQNVLPKDVNPDIYAKLKRLLQIVYAKAKKMNVIDRAFLGDRTLVALRQSVLYYVRYCNSGQTDKLLLRKIDEILRTALVDSMLFVELNIWDMRHCVSEYQDLIIDVITLINSELKHAKQPD